MVFTYEQFISPNPEIMSNRVAYENFTLYFREGNVFSDILRSRDEFKCFMLQNPDLELRIRKAVQQKRVKEVEPDLYRAYLLMRELGADDDELLT